MSDDTGQPTPHPVHRRPFRVFVSYARGDNDAANGGLIRWVQEVINACEGIIHEPIESFVDTVGIEPGEEFPEAIRVELQGADVFIALLSKDYPNRSWCVREVGLFQESSRQRALKGRNLMLVGIGGHGKGALEALSKWPSLEELKLKQLALDVASPFADHGSKAARVLADMLKPLPPRETKGFSIRGQVMPGGRGKQVFQYVSAFDSVRSQRDRGGRAQQTAMIDLRAKLSYLLGYTVVVSETQAFDSLGALYTIAEASKAWVQQPGPVAPFQIAYFRRRKGHVVDIALEKFAGVGRDKAFDFSAWRKHERPRDGGGSVRTTLDDARSYETDWDHFLEAARFLSWFPCERLAEVPPVSLDLYLRQLVETHSRAVTPVDAANICHDIKAVMQRCHNPGNRTSLYQETDSMAWGPDPGERDKRVEAVKDVIDVAYNRTVADSVLFAATSSRHARSMSLTDPTPSQRASGFDDVVKSLLGYRDVTKADSHGYARFQGAWEDEHGAPAANALSWADVFEITSIPKWLELRGKVLQAREAHAASEAWQESTMELAQWLGQQLRENVIVDVATGSITLRAHGSEAGVGHRASRDLGVVGQGQA